MGLRLLLALSLAWVSSAQPSCPDLAMSMRVKTVAALGGTVTVKASVRNVGSTRQEGVAIGITLPDAVWSPTRPIATDVKQHWNGAVSATYQAPGVYWLPLSLPAGKGTQVRIKARVPACPALAGTTLAFTGVVYKTNATDEVLCATLATGHRTSTKVSALKPHAKTLPPSACFAPTPAPGAPYVLVAENQVIAGAEDTPFLERRRRALSDAVDGGGAALAGVHRELPPKQYTVEDCYEACCASGKYTVPFYMNFYGSPTRPKCGCSQKARATIFARGWLVVRIDRLATSQPTESPTRQPTASPLRYPAVSFGSNGADLGLGIAVDASGSSFTTGYFTGTMTVGSTTLTAVGSDDVFIVKLNALGNPLWATSFGSTDSEMGQGIAVDASGSSYTTGYFTGIMIVGSTTLTPVGSEDVFIIKLDNQGNPQWATSFGSTDSDSGYGIAVDASGISYVTGNFAGTMIVGSTTLTSAGNDDIFIVKLDGSGNPLWAKSFGSTKRDSGYDIAVDTSGNCYVTGAFGGSGVGGGTMIVGSTTLTAVGNQDIFIIKLDDQGNPLWATSYGTLNIDRGIKITVDLLGRSYVTGYFSGTMTVALGAEAGSVTLSASLDDIFVIKLGNGGVATWATSFDSNGGNSYPGGIAVDASGNCYTTGFFTGATMTVGSTTLTSLGNDDAFIIKLDDSGNPLWARSFGNTGMFDRGQGIAVSTAGSSYTTGQFTGTMTVGSTTLTAVGAYDVFIIKLDGSGNPAQ